MPALVLAAAQTAPLAGDLSTNLARHLDFIALAARHGVTLLQFPELSLTGYELALARNCAVTLDDARLIPLAEAAQRHAMTIVAGAPLRLGDDTLRLAALIFGPDGAIGHYAKQYLHPGEDTVFLPGEAGLTLTLDDDARTRAALAICADTGHPEHPAAAKRSGAAVYSAGMLLSVNGYAADTQQLQGYAREHRMAVLLANYGAPSSGWQCAGGSALWDENGEHIAHAPANGEALLIAERRADGWHGRSISLD
ncbi:carbon-nitrogen hydrolase family protein [Crenobacter sp. SG2303]|uniref:Carbon-nitrogen hydrolase family protein n=1 Tax=Crenobacter oryzisoli TaxID=3056844 RepID=A0ABT7XLM7_9NEIS|nr:carbon-nitrogen hydrolase family protein [Crenobacter sp. SG2303]MDN0074603.1 carbon-nitrogen hydrolase family protein [Crenobacter sp. SG2303]